MLLPLKFSNLYESTTWLPGTCLQSFRVKMIKASTFADSSCTKVDVSDEKKFYKMVRREVKGLRGFNIKKQYFRTTLLDLFASLHWPNVPLQTPSNFSTGYSKDDGKENWKVILSDRDSTEIGINFTISLLPNLQSSAQQRFSCQ